MTVTEHYRDDAGEWPPALLGQVRQVLAARPCALMTDFDGTLSPIAPTPAAAVLAPGAGEALAAAGRRFDRTVVISGRRVLDLRAKVGQPEYFYVGNHGLEYLSGDMVTTSPGAEPFAPMVARAVDAVEAGVSIEGLRLERKGVTASIHYRLCADRAAARAAVLDLLGRLPEGRELRLGEGRAIIELRPPIDVNKGTAVRQLVRQWGLRGVLFMGDDVTDLDALTALHDLPGVATLGLAVGSPEADPRVWATAHAGVEGVAEAVRFLRSVANLPES